MAVVTAGPSASWLKSRRAQLGVLILGLVTTSMANTVLFTVLGPIARDMGLSEIHVGAIVSVTAIVFAISGAFWGHVSDSWGRKPVFILGIAAYSLGGGLFAYLLQLGVDGFLTGMTAFWILLFVRAALYASFAGAPQPTAAAYIADTTSGADRARGMAFIGASFAFGSVLGPAMGGAFAGYGVVTPLFVIATLGGIMAIVSWFVLIEPKDHASRNNPNRRRLSPFDPRIVPILLVSFLTFVTIASTQQTAAFYVQDITHSDSRGTMEQVSIAMVTMALCLLFSQIVIVQRYRPTPRTMFFAGFPLATVGFLILVVSSELWHVVAAYAAMGLGYGLCNPASQAAVSLAVEEDVQGAAAGYVSASFSAGFIVGPLVGTSLYEIDPHITFGLNAVLALGALGIAALGTAHVRVPGES
jgi:MFS family permease